MLVKARDHIEVFPKYISYDTYVKVRNNKKEYKNWYLGLVGFCSTFCAQYFRSYARDKQTGRNISREQVSNLKKQSPKLKGIKFYNKSVFDLHTNKIKNFVIYCDPPLIIKLNRMLGLTNLTIRSFINGVKEWQRIT